MYQELTVVRLSREFFAGDELTRHFEVFVCKLKSFGEKLVGPID